MCYRKIVTFLCHCPLRNMACCPHSAHIIRDSDSVSKDKPKQGEGEGEVSTNSPASTTSPVPDIPTGPKSQAQEYYCPKTGKRLFWHKRQPREPQGAVHWDPLPEKTVWYPCAGYIATHVDAEWDARFRECEDCPEYYGDSDIETKEVGICGECKTGHKKPVATGRRQDMRRKTFQQFQQAVSRSSSAPEVNLGKRE